MAQHLSVGFNISRTTTNESYHDKLVELLSTDLDFHGDNSNIKSHNYHSFPAKFPPQLPRKFINGLTNPNDLVLDPMNGSGTTVLEALFAHRCGLGFDIDPLAIKITNTKMAHQSIEKIEQTTEQILNRARWALQNQQDVLVKELGNKWDEKSHAFISYWFAFESQLELLALISEIGKIDEPDLRAFFELAFSAIIITKSGGVSLALDLAHTRPHRAKVVINNNGKRIIDEPVSEKRREILTKKLRSPLDEFEKRCRINLDGLLLSTPKSTFTKAVFGDAQLLPLASRTVDLIVTSPPYVSNAIDYMRAHKFSLVWFGYQIDDLGNRRREYIGADAITGEIFENLPNFTNEILSSIAIVDEKKSLVVRRYFSEMKRVLQEMYRVLKPGKSAVLVVGSSMIRGIDTQTQDCLVEIGRALGFEIPKIGVRNLDRNRRMLPAGNTVDKDSQIQQRMHKEFVIGFYKP